MSFKVVPIVNDAEWWWAYNVADVNGDGLQDIVYIHNNARGGYLAYRPGQTKPGMWPEIRIAEAPPTGGTFASGDMETGDMDGDGDIDVLGVKHTGEWDDAGAPAEIFWYENPGWQPHVIGEVPGAVKDLSLADFDDDGRLDLAVLTFEKHNLWVFRQEADGAFSLAVDQHEAGLHEGMDVGDLDGDGDVDIAANGYAFFNPGGDLAGPWPVESIDAMWHDQTGDWSANGTKNACADIDGDGVDEVFISHSERTGYPVSWYKRDAGGAWTEHVVAPEIPACHTLQVFDMDLDGDPDVVAGINFGRAVNLEVDHFETWVLRNEGDNKHWAPVVIAQDGIYNGRVADFEGDGDFDLFRLPHHEAREVFLLINQTKGGVGKSAMSSAGSDSAAALPVDRWTYIQITAANPKWGDSDDPKWLRYFGLAEGDVDGDGFADIITGRSVYVNPGGDMTAPWKRVDLGRNVDASLFADVTGDGRLRIVGEALPDVVEFTYTGDKDQPFASRVVAQIPPTGHRNGQGYRAAQIVPGGPEEVVLASQGGLYLLLPAEGRDSWGVRHVGVDASDEGFAVGDIDGDGDLDLISGFRAPGADAEVPTVVVWFENPGDAGESWNRHDIGRTTFATDRVEAGDLNADGRMDVVVSEERYPGKEPDGNLWVYLQTNDGDGWERRHIVEQYSMNNLDLADLDADGDLDIVTAEHKGDRLSLQVWLNDGQANFGKHEIDHGKESHLGTQLHDMDGDGDLDIVSIGWDQPNFVHLWRNDAK